VTGVPSQYRLPRSSGARGTACSLRNRVDSELRNETFPVGTLPETRPQRAQRHLAAVEPGPLSVRRGSTQHRPDSIENP